MTLQVRPLFATRFLELDLRSLHLGSRLPSLENHREWRAVEDHRRGVLLTQLLSTSAEMRDGMYYYLLAVARRLYFLESSPGKLKVLEAGADGTYPATGLASESEALTIAEAGIQALFEHSTRSRPSTQAILAADGYPLRREAGDV